MDKKEYVFALVGNPNSGKTTLFNELTGSHYEVGNWAGVTVERREGLCKIADYNVCTSFCTHRASSAPSCQKEYPRIRIVDLPGIYSLSPHSAEEVIAQNYILYEKPDLILNIVDATNLERNLYLTLQLLELGTPMVIALNMMDALKSSGRRIHLEKLEQRLGIRILPISAGKRRGIGELITEALKTASAGKPPSTGISYDPLTEQTLARIIQLQPMPRLCALKLLEDDQTPLRTIKPETESALQDYHRHTSAESVRDFIAGRRFSFIRKTVAAAVSEAGQDRQSRRTERMDQIAVHPLFAIPLFILVMFLVFQITFGTFGNMLSDTMNRLINVHLCGCAEFLLEKTPATDFVKALVTDGILAGVGGVVTFFPQIMLLFLFLSFLEDSGYMARTAFIMDKLFTRLGLSGKSFVPLLMGFGCSVPAIMASRTLENARSRRLTAMLTPFMSCGAKMPVYAAIAAAVFRQKAGIVIFCLYLLGILSGAASGLLFSKTVLKGDAPPFLLELPPYRMPTLKSTLHHMWEKAKDFAVRAGTILLAASIVIWLMQNLNPALHPTTDPKDSIFWHLGNRIAPLFAPCGFGTPEAAVSILSGLAAKEAVLSTMSILYGAADSASLIEILSSQFTPASGMAFLIFVLLYVPCIAAVSALRSELNSVKLTLFSICYQWVIAWLLSAAVFRLINLF